MKRYGLAVYALAAYAFLHLPLVILAIFSVNASKLSVWQGFSIRWWWGDPSLSIFHDPDYTHALVHSLELAAFDMLIAVPLGVLLALGLTRWRGRGSGAANGLMLVPRSVDSVAWAASAALTSAEVRVPADMCADTVASVLLNP